MVLTHDLRPSAHTHMRDRFLLVALLSLLTIAALYLFTTFSSVPVNRDAGYYIPLARAVLSGATPTVDIDTGYTPFVYYFLAAWISAFGQTTSSLILAVYLVNALNAFLLFLALLPYCQSVRLRLLLALSYWFTILVCQGYSIFLEPFQVFFLLLALVAYQRTPQRYIGLALAGLAVGASVMCKQYSAFPAAGLALMIASDLWRKTSLPGLLSMALLFILFATLPFLIFVALTPATLLESLQAFGFLGNRALSYALSDVAGLSRGVLTVLIGVTEKAVLVNWLFAPIALYLLFPVRPATPSAPPSPLPAWALSLVPLLSRQWGHYLQLVAPWSFLIAGSLVAGAREHLQTTCRNLTPLLLSGLAVIALLLPLYVVFTPSIKASLPGPALATAGSAVLLASLVLAVGVSSSCGPIRRTSLLLLVLLILGFQSMFLALKLPFSEMQENKSAQATEARLLREIFPPESSVYVVDYPELYVTAQLIAPGGRYGFTHSAGRQYVPLDKATDWGAVDRVALRPGAPDVEGFLERAHFVRIEANPALQLLLYEKKSEPR